MLAAKKIILKSGWKVEVCAISVMDAIESAGEIPDSIEAELRSKSKSARASASDLKRGYRMAVTALCRCTRRIESPDGTSTHEGRAWQIVDKPFADCSPHEIPVCGMDQTDAAEIINTVFEMSGLGGGAARAAKFPEPESEPGGQPASPVEIVRAVAV